MNKRFEVASIHLCRECNMHCKFCYRDHSPAVNEKDMNFWVNLIPYLKKLNIDQIAVGGGEPMLRGDMMYAFSHICKREKIIFNFTTNGTLIESAVNCGIKRNYADINDLFNYYALLNTTMISISYDSEKIKNLKDAKRFEESIRALHREFPHLKIGVNYLCDDSGLEKLASNVKFFLDDLKLDRVFALSPKNFENNILKYRQIYQILTMLYPKFFVDDLTKCIIEENSYKNWKQPCHFGKVLSIDECGNVGGCSFDLDKVKCLTLDKPKDILKINDIEFKERFNCPYLVEGNK